LLRSAEALLFSQSAMTNATARFNHSCFIFCLTILTSAYFTAYKVIAGHSVADEQREPEKGKDYKRNKQ
jgi:hypothetical protein